MSFWPRNSSGLGSRIGRSLGVPAGWSAIGSYPRSVPENADRDGNHLRGQVTRFQSPCRLPVTTLPLAERIGDFASSEIIDVPDCILRLAAPAHRPRSVQLFRNRFRPERALIFVENPRTLEVPIQTEQRIGSPRAAAIAC